MLYLKPVIERIEKLASSDSSADLTYAALECRLAIERICYERLRISHDYIAHDDLRRWQPKDVVNFLVQEVDPKIASTYTLSMSKDPVAENESLEGIGEDRKWVKIGTQVGFDAKKLGELWNALSNVALHVRLPTSKGDLISEYGDPSKIAAKVKECLEELRRIAEGTLLGTGMGEEVTFECACGRAIKRRSQRLRHDQVISCVGADCLESYRVEKDGDDYFFERRKHGFTCKKCGYECSIPLKPIEKLSHDKSLYVDCGGENCDQRFLVAWRLMEAQIDRPVDTKS